MIQSHLGEFAALLVAVFWTFTALAFESASVKVGSLAVNFIRLLFAFIFLSIYTGFNRGNPLPSDATGYQWEWLSLSGLVGFVLGDLFLFKSYTIIGSRMAMLIMNLVPPITAIIGWLVLGETMSLFSLLGMALAFLGITIATFSRDGTTEKLSFNIPVRGFLFALGGAAGQAIGLVLSKKGMGSYNAFAATQIRIITGIIGFGALVLFLGRSKNIINAFRHKQGMTGIVIGSFFGPFLGVSLSLYSVQHTGTGIASTIMAMVPILIIAPSAFVFKQKVTFREVLGAVISVVGVAFFFIK